MPRRRTGRNHMRNRFAPLVLSLAVLGAAGTLAPARAADRDDNRPNQQPRARSDSGDRSDRGDRADRSDRADRAGVNGRGERRRQLETRRRQIEERARQMQSNGSLSRRHLNSTLEKLSRVRDTGQGSGSVSDERYQADMRRMDQIEKTL